MKLLVLLLIALLLSNQAFADNQKQSDDKNKQPSESNDRYKATICSKCNDSDTCQSKKCYWHSGHCADLVDCKKYSAEECLNHKGCVQKETSNGGRCIKRDYTCATHLGQDECARFGAFCSWSSNSTCEAVPGFVANCPAKTIEECKNEQYCTYTTKCYNNYYPSKSWKLCKEDCIADQFSNWVILHPAYCIDNIKFCPDLSIDDCKNHTDHCVIERYYNETNSTYSLCNENNDPNYQEKCVPLQYGCQDLSIEDCQNNQFCKVIDEIGQCYPKKLVDCETLSADDCAANSHCCLKEECADNPQIIECPAKTIEECRASEECRVIDNGSCTDIDFDCANLSYLNCQNDHCQWIPDKTNQCVNKKVCKGLNYDDCKEYCDECTWKKDTCKYKK